MNKIKATILTIATLAALAGVVAYGGSGRAYTRQLWSGQTLTSTAASNSTSVAIGDFEPGLGKFAVETRIRGTGTVEYVHLQVSQDGSVWYASNPYVVSNQAVSVATGGTSTNAYTAVSGVPVGLFYRLSGLATTNSPIVDAWIVLQ